MSLPTAPYRDLFSRFGNAQKLDPRLLEAVAMVESAGKPRAFRYEPHKRDASFGLMQVMGETARDLGLPSTERDAVLCEPDVCVMYGTKVLCQNLDGLNGGTKQRNDGTYLLLSDPLPREIRTALARYNGGWRDNPGPDGSLRNEDYAAKVEKALALVRLEVT